VDGAGTTCATKYHTGGCMVEVDSTLTLLVIKKLYEKLASEKDLDKIKYLLSLITRHWMLLEHSYFYIMDVLLYWHFMESGNPITEDIELINFKRSWSWYRKPDTL